MNSEKTEKLSWRFIKAYLVIRCLESGQFFSLLDCFRNRQILHFRGPEDQGLSCFYLKVPFYLVLNQMLLKALLDQAKNLPKF